MPRPTDKPLARAQEHLASARYAEAAGAFRAVLHIDPLAFQAHFGLADALVARGQHAEAIEGLVEAAEACGEQDDHAAALTLYGKALAIDPGRLELHLDVAIAEAALGRDEAASTRLEGLAEIYMQAGRTDEAAEVYRFLSSWEEQDDDDDDDDDDTDHGPDATAQQPWPGAVPAQIPTSETVVIPTILVTPDGQLLQMPIARETSDPMPAAQHEVPTVPAELLQAAHSKPIDLAEGSQLRDLGGTVVAFPPPPPTLPREQTNPGVSREDLEAALAAAMENLELVEQMEEEDETIIMRAPLLPPRKKRAAPVKAAGPARTSDGKLRIERAPRPKSAAPPAQTKQPGSATMGSRSAPAPRPQRAPVAKTKLATPRPHPTAPATAPAKPTPARPRATTPAPRPVAAPRPSPATAAGGPVPAGPRPTRPNNPLVDRLRRRAGLSQEGRGPKAARTRPTEPISVGRSAGRRRGRDPGPDDGVCPERRVSHAGTARPRGLGPLERDPRPTTHDGSRGPSVVN
ncbi:MAG: tetratricopeptide repeat protein, partial [Nannocystaceae bacterium]